MICQNYERKQSSCFEITWRPGTKEASGVSLCVRQNGVTKQQTCPWPWAFIIRNIQKAFSISYLLQWLRCSVVFLHSSLVPPSWRLKNTRKNNRLSFRLDRSFLCSYSTYLPDNNSTLVVVVEQDQYQTNILVLLSKAAVGIFLRQSRFYKPKAATLI